MISSPDETAKNAAMQIKEQILYMPEYRELIPELIKKFNPRIQTKGYLGDLLLAQHALLKLLTRDDDFFFDESVLISLKNIFSW